MSGSGHGCVNRVKTGRGAMSAAMSGLPESSRRADIGRLSRHCNPAIAAVCLTKRYGKSSRIFGRDFIPLV
jgi:hypothetical protein